MPAPTITVCIPAYRAEAYMQAALESVRAQTFTDWEIVVTEDGSKDGVEAIVRAFASSVEQPVVYNRHEKNRGLPATRNTGIAAARGEWIAFLDADDLWQPGHLEHLVAAADDADMVFSGTIPFDDVTGEHQTPCVPTADDLANLPLALYAGRLSVLPSSVMIRKDAFARFGLISLEFPIVNDTEYWLRLLRGGGQPAYSGATTCLYRRHAASMSRRAAAILQDSARLCEHYADWSAIPSKFRRSRPANLYRWAGSTLLNDQPAEAMAMLKRSLRLQPLNPKTLGLCGKAVLRRWTAPHATAGT
jgi:glycosyltransferase involved in cell wall biosynthesis